MQPVADSLARGAHVFGVARLLELDRHVVDAKALAREARQQDERAACCSSAPPVVTTWADRQTRPLVIVQT